MRDEKSCGAVVFTRDGQQLRYVLVHELSGCHSFPKGHVEAGETEEETALREIREETGLTVRLLPGFRTVDEHPLREKPGTMKQIVYFLAEYSHQPLVAQASELRSVKLLTYEQAMDTFEYESSRRILTEADEFLAKQSGKR